MKPEDDSQDRTLREHLRLVGRAAEKQAPDFQHVWRQAQSQLACHESVPRSFLPGWAFAAAAAAVCLAAILWAIHPAARTPAIQVAHFPGDAAFIQKPVSFDAGAPTDFLLTAGNETRPPSLDALTEDIDALLKP